MNNLNRENHENDSSIADRLDRIAVCSPQGCFPKAEGPELARLAAEIEELDNRQDYPELRRLHLIHGWSKCLDAMHLAAAHRHLLPSQLHA